MPPTEPAHFPRWRSLWIVAGCALALAGGPTVWWLKSPGKEKQFVRLMNAGKSLLDGGQATNAIPLYAAAVKLFPARPEAHLNLANAFLLAGQSENALKHAEEALNFDRNCAAASYVAGCANLRLRRFQEALRMFQMCHDLDRTVAAVSYQLGRAHQELGHWDEAIAAYTEAVTLEPQHPVAHYALSQVLVRVGRQDEALKCIETHKQILAKAAGGLATAATFERCKHTQARAPAQTEAPRRRGIPVVFVDATSAAFNGEAAKYHGPLAVLDYNHDDRNSLFVAEGTNGFRLLGNTKGTFAPLGAVWPVPPGGNYRQCLVGDLNNDRFEDVLVLGEPVSHAFRFATNGAAREVTAAAGLRSLSGFAAGLVDLDFRGNLDLLVVSPEGKGLRALRNLGNFYFKDITATSGVPAALTGLGQLAIEDWNNDDLMDVLVARAQQPPLLLLKQRGGPLVATNLPPGRLGGAVLAVGDLNNDSRADVLVAGPNHLDLLLGGINRFSRLALDLSAVNSLTLVDYDNDGWLDLLAAGAGLRLFRNLGDGHFEDATKKVGLDKAANGLVEAVAAADFDQDGDTDLVVSVAGQGLKFLRNDGGNANYQLKIRLFGNRSNASGLGIRLEAAAAAFRLHRTVSALPVELGLGKHAKVDSLTARWFDQGLNIVDVKPDPRAALVVLEPELPTGSCPYLYAWDGRRFRFVSDILGSAPLGLRVADTVFADADPHEFVWLGDETMFPPREGSHQVQITEELREVLYLDEAKLVVADHPVGTEVHTTDKFRPGKPFPRGELWTLGNRRPLRAASHLDGSDVTALLAENDGQVVSPAKLRAPQLRGLAEPHGVFLDYGPLPVARPLVLALTGWLRFGGGWANVAASHNPELPFPFPQLEVETAADKWQPVETVVGAPSGKTKTILVDLAGKLPPGSQRLRLTTAYEIHWDRIALFERLPAPDTRITRLRPDHADLHWRGFSEFADLPWTAPLTPVYEQVFENPHWAITPMGWCTRYGSVDGLVAAEDNALVLLNGGDELTLSFSADRLPPKPAGSARDFFLYTVGWDKDADFHVELGWQVEPLPWHGMDDQLYGHQPRPAFPNDGWLTNYNTRWVGQHTLKRAAR
jgi:tetratricopeptide (TPR) repeat protein